MNNPDELPTRRGPMPRIHPGPPQMQLDQLPSAEEWTEMRRLVAKWRSAVPGPSRRAAPGTLGLHLDDADAGSSTEEAFLIGNEFAHHHPDSDGGLHLVLPPAWHAAAMKKGWAFPHTLAGRPTVSRWTLLVFAPRDAEERAVVLRLVQESEKFARGES